MQVLWKQKDFKLTLFLRISLNLSFLKQIFPVMISCKYFCDILQIFFNCFVNKNISMCMLYGNKKILN